MNDGEFREWLEHHCNYFDGVRAFAKRGTLDAWRSVLASVSLDDAKAATQRLYESEIRPRSVSDHAISIKRAAREIASRRGGGDSLGPTKGDMEHSLRIKFQAEWEALGIEGQRRYLARAADECRVPSASALPPEMLGLLTSYAWTLFAEAQDPEEAKRIRNTGWMTPASVAAQPELSYADF